MNVINLNMKYWTKIILSTDRDGFGEKQSNKVQHAQQEWRTKAFVMKFLEDDDMMMMMMMMMMKHTII